MNRVDVSDYRHLINNENTSQIDSDNRISQIETENNLNNLLNQNNNNKKESSSKKNTVSMIDVINNDMKNALKPLNSKKSSESKKSGSFKKNKESDKKIESENKSSGVIKMIQMTAEKNKDLFQTPPGMQTPIPNIFLQDNKEKKKKKKNGIQNGEIPKRRQTVIFWEKEKFEVLRVRFKEAKEKILKKTETDFETIKNNVLSHENEKVLSTMLDDEFKRFYKLNLKNSDILEFIVKEGEIDLLLKILKDPFYTFNKNFIFEVFTPMLKSKDSHNPRDLELLTNLIKNDLYNEEHIDLILWYIALFRLYDLFRLLIERSNSSTLNLDDFQSDSLIDNYAEDAKNYYEALNKCLENKLEELAKQTVSFFLQFSDESVLNTAIKNCCMKFLQYCWELSYIELEKPNFKSNLHASKLYSSFQSSHSMYTDFTKNLKNITNLLKFNKQSFSVNKDFNNGLLPFTLSTLVDKLEKQKLSEQIRHVLDWKFIDKDSELLQRLFDHRRFDEISLLIFKHKKGIKWNLTREMFKIVIDNEELELIIYFLRIKDCRVILEDHSIQKKIVEKYIKFGHKFYYGAEMLSYIYKIVWNNELTKELCKSILNTIKKREILNCSSPILTCLILCEFLDMISGVSILNTTRCNSTMKELLEFSKNIQYSNQDESYIRFLMTQKDSKNRTAFQIASDNNFLDVLQNPEIGTIIGKMWNGEISHNGFFTASSLYRYLDANNKSFDPFSGFEKLDTSKNYFYQLDVWTDSCSLRFWPESLCTIILIMLYNVYIWNVSNRQIIMLPYHQYSSTGNSDLLVLLYIYTLWMIIIVMNIFNQLIFVVSTERNFKLDYWQMTDIVAMGTCFTLYLDIEKYFNIAPNIGFVDVPFLVRGGILSANNIFVWMRIMGILLTFKEVGPMLSLMFELSVLLGKYIILYGLWIVCMAAVFTSIFFKYSDLFKEFSIAVFNLIGGFIQNFNAKAFTNYVTFGQGMMMLYITISGILLINLLIAMLNSVYEEMNNMVDASHRAVIINYFRRYKWESKYGYLIFLTTPLNILNYIVFPITYCFNEKTRLKINESIVKFYFLAYFSLILLWFMIATLILLPICYLKGLFYILTGQTQVRISNAFKILNILKWIVGGGLYVVYIYFRDIFLILSTVYKKIKVDDGEMVRLKKYIKADDVIIFLKFLHSQNKSNDSNDLHSVFHDYIVFEQKYKSENNDKLKEKSNYLKRLNSKNKKTSTMTGLLIHNNEDHDTSITGSYMKKNLIIIEILENFMKEDFQTGKKMVDIEKLQMLLPKTMNIDNNYLKRLIHSDISSMNKAINKLKQKKDIFQQFQIMNAINNLAIRIDKEIDLEIQKFHRRRQHEIAFFKKKSDIVEEEPDYTEPFVELLDNIKFDIEMEIEKNKPMNSNR